MNGDSVLVLHERALNDTIELDDPHDMTGSSEGEPTFPGGQGSAYGGGGDCSSIVQGALSVVDGSGKVTHSLSLAGVVLPVDVAVSADGRMIAVADAGQHDLGAPSRSPFFDKAGGVASGGVGLFNIAEQPLLDSDTLGQGCMFSTAGNVQMDSAQPTAVAFTPDGTLVVQSRQPAQLALFSADGVKTIALGGEDRLDTGHEIFHRDAGAGIACASCHGEAGDDGHVWNFSTFGPRRTQSIQVGLEGTEPFHWSGDMADLTMLVREVFVDRMGGVPQSDSRVDALAAWMFAQQAPTAPRAANDEAALRGQHLFESKEVGCTGCHNGLKLTDNRTMDVGTGEPMQVPSLVGIAYRAPFIHTGCAKTLHERFDPACGGGDKHGKTSHLTSAEIDDLVAYLETL
jgi:mono/diheme cytochrome c family protein